MGVAQVSLIGKGVDRFDREKLRKEELEQRKIEVKKQRNLKLAPLVEKEAVEFNKIGFKFLHSEEGVGFFALEDTGYEEVVAVITAISGPRPYMLSCKSKIKTFGSVEDLFDELGYALRTLASGSDY
jgi:hypothetical protein